MKSCKRGHVRSLSNSRLSKDGLWKACKECDFIRRKEWRTENKERESIKTSLYNKEYILRDKEKARARWIKRHHNISLEEYDALLLSQNNKCANNQCHTILIGKSRHLDHDHETGKIRGMLCNKCNMALGLLRDNPDIVLGLHSYIKYHKI